MTPASDVPGMTSRARIAHLESNVSGLWTAVRYLEERLGCVPTEAGRPRLPSQAEDAPPHGCDDDSDSDSASSDLSNPPTHLLPLFDNSLLSSGSGTAPPPRDASSLHQAPGISVLRRLMPSRKDMLTITAHASSWLSLYNSLFPSMGVTKTSDEMLLHYDQLQDPNAGPVAIAALLLSVALTVQQAPDDTTGPAAQSISNASSFIKDVSDTVERIVVSDDTLVGSLEGIETTLLFLRLYVTRPSFIPVALTMHSVSLAVPK